VAAKEKQEQMPEKETTTPPKPKYEPKVESQPDPLDEANPDYQINDLGGLGMVELDADGVVGGEDEDEERPPGR